MTDPITCPECQGSKGVRLGGLFLACQFCGGRGMVGGDHEPAEPPPPPTAPPPAWEHRVWHDPAVATAISCRLCFDVGMVTHVDRATRTLATTVCACRST